MENTAVKKLFTPFWLSLIFLSMMGCSSLRQADLASGKDAEGAIKEVTRILEAAEKDQIDVLADEQFNQGKIYLSDAERSLKEGGLAETVLTNAAIAKAFFEDARETAELRRPLAIRILKARGAALEAGARKDPSIMSSMQDVDDDLKSDTKHFSRTLKPEAFSTFQKKYLALEVRAVQFSELGDVKQAIKQAIDDDADDRAPKTLRTAQLDYENAMNIVAKSPRSPEVYSKGVQDSLASATQLVDVMNVIKGAKGTPENIAIQIVQQKRQLGELSTNVGKLQKNLDTTKQSLQAKEGALKQKESELKRTEGVLKSQEEQLALASRQVRFQQAMDEAREVIPQEDALVYQQGTRLVFRLKRINFPTGTSAIPESSKPLISKVDTIIKKLDAEKVIVQGHTDSVGSDEVNKKLSQNRALAVANYLYSLKGGYKIQYAGYGESHPIASNETAEGRATNRRVDLVVSVKE
jgi:OOP family OmpA-OmpF porin